MPSIVTQAATIVWRNTGTTFSTGANWIGGTAPANSLNTDIGSFTAATATNNPILTGNRSINGLLFASGTAGWSFSGNSGTRVLRLGASGIDNEAATTQTFSSANLGIALGANAAFTSNSTGALSFGSTLASFNLSTFTLTLNGSSTNASNAIGAVIAGSGRITKSGTGTWEFTGANTYSGTTTVSAGTILANGSSSLGASAGNVTVSAGGTLALAGGAGLTAGSPTNAVTITKSGTLSLNGTGAAGATGALQAVGSTGQTSAWIGNITLSGNATVSGADNLLVVGDGSTYANTINLGSNTLTFNTTSATGVTPVYLTAPGYALDSSNILVNSQISGSGGIIKTGAGTVTLISFPSNTYTGTTVVNGGKLIVDGAGDAPVISSTSVTVGNAVTPGAAGSVILQMGQSGSASVNQLIGTYSGSPSNIASTSMTVYADGLFNMNSGSNALTSLTLQGGQVDMGGSSALLTLTGGLTTNASSQTALITNGYLGMSANSFAINVAAGTTASGVDLQIDSFVQNGIGFTGSNTTTSLAKTGAGTLVLTADNSGGYAGVTDIQAGVLNIRNNSALGQTGSSTGDLNNGTVVESGAQLQLQNNITVGSETLTLNGTGIASTGALLNNSGANTYNGEVILGANSRINANSGSTLTIANTAGTGATIITGSAAGRTLTLGGAGNINVNSVISANIGTLVKDGTGTATLAGDYTANTTTTVNDGTLALNMGGTVSRGLSAAATVTIGDGIGSANSATVLLQQSNQIADSAAVSLNTDGALNVNGHAETIGSIAGSGNILLGTGQLIAGGSNASTTYSGTLSGAAGSNFTKAGSGTLTLSSNLNAGSGGNFLGTLDLTAGTILVSASNTFSGTVNVAAGTTLRLSDSTLNIANLNFTGSGTITLDFAGTASILNVTNLLTVASGVTIQIINWQNAVDFFYAANWSGAVLDLTGSTPMNQIVFDSPTWVGNNTKWQGYDHQVTPVPEPSTYGVLLLGAMGALLGWRRYRKTKPALKSAA